MLKRKNNILILVSSKSSFYMLVELANQLILRDEKVIFLFDFMCVEIVSLLDHKAIPYLFFEEVEKNIRPLLKIKQNYFFKRSQPPFKQKYGSMSYKKMKASTFILKKYTPKIIIVAEDGITSNYWFLTKAKKKKVPILDCPFGYGSQQDLENALTIKKENNELIIPNEEKRKLINKKQPQWIKKGKHEGAILFEPDYLLSLFDFGIKIYNPWTVHGGMADKIAVESKKMYQHYLREGIQEGKLTLTGSLYCDQLYQTLKSKESLNSSFERSKPIDPKKRSLLVCWIPNYDSDRKKHLEFENYNQMTEMVFSYLSTIKDIDITVSLHPNAPKDVSKIIEKHGAIISNKNIFELIVKHDIYLSCFSSTIRYAIACAKPVVNYDMYKFNLNEYEDEKGVITIKTFFDLKKTIQNLVEDRFYKVIAELQKKSSSEWGFLDNENFSRIYRLIMDLSSKRNIPKSYISL